MTGAEFNVFFFVVLDERIPTEARDVIQKYWMRFKTKPTLILNDTEIEAVFGHQLKVAAVSGNYCLDRFGFREFIVQHAPKQIIQTIIQHELIHCYLDSQDSPEKYLNELTRRSSFDIPRSPVAKVLAQIAKINQRLAAYNAEEIRVTAINKVWGGDDDEAHNWIQTRTELKK